MTSPTPQSRPPAWKVLEQALTDRRAVIARYHGHERVLSPHALGWKDDRAKVLVYQSDGTTSTGGLPTDTRQRWRSMFIDELEEPKIIDRRWETAENYSLSSNGIDELVLHVPPNVAK
jgi:hypothetical protein